MLIAQITDLHVRAQSYINQFGVDNNANVACAVALLNALEPKPDVVIVTGDLTNDGKPDEYIALVELLGPLRYPVYLIPGNHDEAHAVRSNFPGHRYLPSQGPFLHYVIEKFPLRLIGLDTTLPGRHDGALCVERLRWLDECLSARSDTPTLIFMHHPPFKTGIWWMDSIGLLEGANAFKRLIREHSQVKQIVCGHLHRAIHSQIGSTTVSVSPSTAYQVHLDTTPEGPPRFIAEPSALQLHHWNDEQLVTHTALIDYPARPIDLRPVMSNWEERSQAYRDGGPIPKVVDY